MTFYYYADNVYYRWDAGRSGYLVSEPPRDAAADTISASVNEVFVYPKNGQNAEQQSKDRYECYRWAADQSGFDPTKAGGGRGTDARDAYQPALLGTAVPGASAVRRRCGGSATTRGTSPDLPPATGRLPRDRPAG